VLAAADIKVKLYERIVAFSEIDRNEDGVVVACLRVPSRHYPGRAEENHDNLQSI
jgi:hypothetical protein